MSQLPPPVTSTEEYLSRILDELVVLNDKLDAAAGGAQTPSIQAPPLPASFPGREQLEQSGIVTLMDVPRTAKQLKAIPGIGTATATQILKELKK